MSAWQHVELARHPERPRAEVYVRRLVDGFVELSGDRATHDDPCMLAGVGTFRGTRVAVLAQRPGVSGAGALRKAIRMVELAERFELALLCFIDVSGKHEAEHGAMWVAVGQAAERLLEAQVPSVSVLVGEGVSGAALALACCDRFLALEHAFLCATAPEAVSAILWRTPDRAADAAALLELTAEDLVRVGLCTRVVPEGEGAHLDPDAVIARTGDALAQELAEAERAPKGSRRARFSAIARPA